MPLVVGVYDNACLARPFESSDSVELIGRRLPPRCTVAPFPVVITVRLCSDVSPDPVRTDQFDDSFVLFVTMYTRDLSSLRVTMTCLVRVRPFGLIELETPVQDPYPAFRATCRL